MLFAMSLSDNLFYGFLLFCFLCWYGMRKLRDLDSGGEFKKRVKVKLLGTLMRLLK